MVLGDSRRANPADTETVSCQALHVTAYTVPESDGRVAVFHRHGHKRLIHRRRQSRADGEDPGVPAD
jgi:hypothetical protein